jgi:hypothetical protein
MGENIQAVSRLKLSGNFWNINKHCSLSGVFLCISSFSVKTALIPLNLFRRGTEPLCVLCDYGSKFYVFRRWFPRYKF